MAQCLSKKLYETPSGVWKVKQRKEKEIWSQEDSHYQINTKSINSSLFKKKPGEIKTKRRNIKRKSTVKLTNISTTIMIL